jgi:hypothetical protein
MRRVIVACAGAACFLLLAGPTSFGDDPKGDLPKDGPGDPKLTYDVVAKDTSKYVGKRVVWLALATTGSKKEAAVAANPDAKDARKYKMYAVRFGTEKELQDLFFADKVKITGTVAGTLKISYEVSGPGGEGKEKRTETVPLIVHPKVESAKR